MKFSDFIVYSAIQADLAATDKAGAIREMFTALSSAGTFPASALESCITFALKREELGTTGIGAGVALPMTVWPELDHGVAAVFLSQRGLDFDAVDGEPVHLFFAIVKQPKNPKYHLCLLEYLNRAMKLEAKWSRLKQCRSRSDIIDWLDAVDTVLAG